MRRLRALHDLTDHSREADVPGSLDPDPAFKRPEGVTAGTVDSEIKVVDHLPTVAWPQVRHLPVIMPPVEQVEVDQRRFSTLLQGPAQKIDPATGMPVNADELRFLRFPLLPRGVGEQDDA